MMFDAESQTPVATTPVLARVRTFDEIEDLGEVIDQATSVFDSPPDTPMPYAPVIEETEASLLGPRSVLYSDTSPAVAQLAYGYSTPVISRPLLLGTRDDTLRPPYYDKARIVVSIGTTTYMLLHPVSCFQSANSLVQFY
jgi:hypothetical protein